MAMSYMEMIYIDDGGNARHTNVRAAFKTNAETWAQFQMCREFAVPKDRCKFLLDYYNAKGDLADTILLDTKGYARIANEPVLPDAAYIKIDNDYWSAANMELVPRAVWTHDCQGKQDFDGPLFSVSSRYYPGPGGGGFMSVSNGGAGPVKIETVPYGSQPSAVSAIHLRLGPAEKHDGGGDYYVWKRAEFKAPTEAEVKAQVEAWVTERMAEIVTALGGMSQFRAG